MTDIPDPATLRTYDITATLLRVGKDRGGGAWVEREQAVEMIRRLGDLLEQARARIVELEQQNRDMRTDLIQGGQR